MTDPSASPHPSPHGNARFLADVVVLDVGDEATTLAAEYLAELGATVLRIEDCAGDSIRARGELTTAVLHAGKHSAAIDTTTDDGWAPVVAALGGVDLVIGPIEANPATQRFLDRVADTRRIGLVEVVARRDGDRNEPATDLTVSALGGLTFLNGRPDDPPVTAAGELGWKQVSITVAYAALALLTARRRTGQAGHVVVSAQEAVTYTTLQTANANIWHWRHETPSRHKKPADGATMQSSDGQWLSFTIHPPNWPRFVEWARRVFGEETFAEPEWSDPVYVANHRPEIQQLTARLAAITTRDDLIAEGQARGLLVLPVNELRNVATDEHLAARDFFVDIEQPDGSTTRLAGSPFRSSLGRGERGPAPVLGADNAELERLQQRQPTAGPDPVVGDPRRPLAGVRVVDFCWAAAGPLTTRLLADLGADVIKIESEHRLDPIRHVGPQPTDVVSLNTNGVFHDCNAGKRAVTINLDTEDGRQLVRELIATADIVTANYTPDRLDRWGFDAATLERLRPGLIVANLAVMGTFGPNKGWRSYGNGIVAMTGIAAHTGFPGRLPECLGTMHTDFTVPYFAATQLLAALHHRDWTGQGAYLELSQYESAVRLLDVELAEVLAGGEGPGRRGNASNRFAPHGVYPCAGDDRWVALACRTDAERERLATLIDSDSLDDGSVASWTASRTREEVVLALRAIAVPVARVEDLNDHRTESPMREFWLAMTLPEGAEAHTMHVPILWDGERLPLERAPMWMEHTYDVLTDDLGVSPDRFAALLEAKVLW